MSSNHAGRWLGCCTLLGALLAGPALGASPDTPQAHGLIVQLKQAPSHEALARAHALAASGRSAMQVEHERMRKVLGQSGLAAAKLRPVGRAAQLIDVGHPMGAAEAQAITERLRASAEVEWVVPNQRERRLQTVPDDPLFNASASSVGQWWLHTVSGSNNNTIAARLRGVPGIQAAWVTHQGSALAPVAVLDTGITNHPDLAAHVLPGYDMVSIVEFANDGNGRDADPSDPGDWVTQADKNANPALFDGCDIANSSWHGTDIAGILAAVTDNGSGGAAVSWNGRVVPVRVAGKCGAELADIVDGMRWAAGLLVADGNGGFLPRNANPVRVVNISFGGSAVCGPMYQSAIDELAANGVVVVAPAGNEHGSVTRPASCAGVVAVGALNRDGFKATYSNFGPQLTISTVGGDSTSDGAWGALLGDDGLLTLDNNGIQGSGSPIYSRLIGSSFAAPVTAGTIALMLSVNPTLTVAQIIDGLRQSARPHVTSPKIGACSANNPGRCICSTLSCGAGILDAEQALLYAQSPGSYVPPVRQAAVIDNAEVSAAAALGNDLPPNGSSTTPPASGGGGGGALNPAWLVALASAVGVLATQRRRITR